MTLFKEMDLYKKKLYLKKILWERFQLELTAWWKNLLQKDTIFNIFTLNGWTFHDLFSIAGVWIFNVQCKMVAMELS